MAKIVKETIHANGVDVGIYTSDFQNEYISITDIAFEFASWISPEFCKKGRLCKFRCN